MNKEHTPGPWKMDGKTKQNLGIYIHAPFYGSIASVFIAIPQGEANAKLIAAAPELLEALRLILAEMAIDEYDKKIGYGKNTQKALAAIKKATE